MLNTFTFTAWKNVRYRSNFWAINVFPRAGRPTIRITNLSDAVAYSFVTATSNNTGLSLGDVPPGGRWGTGLSTLGIGYIRGFGSTPFSESSNGIDVGGTPFFVVVGCFVVGWPFSVVVGCPFSVVFSVTRDAI